MRGRPTPSAGRREIDEDWQGLFPLWVRGSWSSTYLCFTGFVGVIVQVQMLDVQDIFEVTCSVAASARAP